MKTLMLLALAGLSILSVHAAEPTGTLTLACEGTATNLVPDAKPIPVSKGIIIDFAERTVKGFGVPPLDEGQGEQRQRVLVIDSWL